MGHNFYSFCQPLPLISRLRLSIIQILPDKKELLPSSYLLYVLHAFFINSSIISSLAFR